jgi:hypothetical protein
MKRIMALTLTLSLIAGCATQGDQAKGEGTLLGAGIGAAVGAGIGALAGGGKGAAIGAGAGALLGALGGYSYASSVEKRHQELAGKENDLDARIAYAKGINEDTQKYNEDLSREVTELQQHADKVAAQVRAQEISQRELEQERASLQKKAAAAEKGLQVANQQLDELKRYRSQHSDAQHSAELDRQIQELETQVADLRANTSALASLGQRF